MSNEVAEVKLSKEEKRARKQEKRRRKEAKLAAKDSQATGVVPAETTSISAASVGAAPLDEVGKKEKERKEKKEKKRKRDTDGVEGVESVRMNKAKKAVIPAEQSSAATANTTPVETPILTPAETASTLAEPLSKKQLKKIARAAALASGPSTSTSSPELSVPLASSLSAPSRPFTAAHNLYLGANAITLSPPAYPPTLAISELPVRPAILSFLSRFDKPTPIQACSWPALLARRDVVGIAETGSGKTLAFGVPGIQGIATGVPLREGEAPKKTKRKHVRMLVIAPTRELALQSHETLEALGEALDIRSVCVYGGVGKDEQVKAIKGGAEVVVGTPGRVLDLADSGDLDFSKVSYMVLDEADRMLDQGFENDIRRIFAHCPGKESRQTVMFSATWPESVRRLASTFLNDPIRITVGSEELSANKRIEQIVEVLDHSHAKDARMLHHLRTHLKSHPSTPSSPTRILVFALYKKEAQRLESTISRSKFRVAGLHGDMGQAERFKALDRFKRGEVDVLVATDVAARGLDIPDVGLVINVTFPLTTEDFVHRCGRTGRAGKSGRAVTFFTGENHERSLAGEFVRVLRDAGAEEMDRFPVTIKKKEHGSYGAFYKDISDAPAATKITFD